MNMNMNTKQVGQICESRFVYECAKRGVSVSQPIGDNAPYDFVVDINGRLIRIQCKTMRGGDDGTLNFSTCSIVGHRKNKKRTTYDGKVDYFFAFNEEMDIWVIVPVGIVGSSQFTIRISPPLNNQTKGINFLKDFQEWFK